MTSSSVTSGLGRIGLVLGFLTCASAAFGQDVLGCGSLQNAYGPFDYASASDRAKHLPIVEEYHFTPDVARLVHGNTGALIQDLDYTLRAFPNHYRALQAVSRYALGGGKVLARMPAECYFRRAVAFRPSDPLARVIYANYLLECTRLRDAQLRRTLRCAGYSDAGYMDPRVLKEARAQYERALSLAPGSPEVNYSAALFYVDMNELETAKKLANVAYGAGYPLMGLKKKLREAQAQQEQKRSKDDG